MPRLRRQTFKAVPGSNTGANGIIPNVKPVGARRGPVDGFPGRFNPNPRPPGNPTGRRTSHG